MRKFLLFILFVFLSFTFFAQPVMKDFHHCVGFQYNPGARQSSDFIWRNTGTPVIRVFALRYGYHIHKNIMIGSEFSGSIYKIFSENMLNVNSEKTQIFQSDQFNFGIIGRYSLRKLDWFMPFMELNAYYSIINSWANNYGNYSENQNGYISGCISPGFSICFLKNRISLDIMMKFSNKEFFNEKKKILSFKINYNLNFQN